MTVSDFESRLQAALGIRVDERTLERLDDALAARIAHPSTPRIRRWRLAVAIAAIAVALPLAAVVTAGILHTEDPFGLSDAAAFQAEVDAAKQVVALPPGAHWPAYLNVKDQDGGYSRGGGRFEVESAAFCLWLGAWLDATRTGDAAAAEQARSTLLAVPTWTLYTSPFADQSYRDVLDQIIAGAETRDPSGDAFRHASVGACSIDPRA